MKRVPNLVETIDRSARTVSRSREFLTEVYDPQTVICEKNGEILRREFDEEGHEIGFVERYENQGLLQRRKRYDLSVPYDGYDSELEVIDDEAYQDGKVSVVYFYETAYNSDGEVVWRGIIDEEIRPENPPRGGVYLVAILSPNYIPEEVWACSTYTEAWKILKGCFVHEAYTHSKRKVYFWHRAIDEDKNITPIDDDQKERKNLFLTLNVGYRGEDRAGQPVWQVEGRVGRRLQPSSAFARREDELPTPHQIWTLYDVKLQVDGDFPTSFRRIML